MFLSNQKYWKVTYKYSNEFDEYLQSIINFLSNLISTSKDEFKLIDINRYSSLQEEDKTDYPNNEHFFNTIAICLSEISDGLFKNLDHDIQEILNNKFSSEDACLFQYKKTIYCIKKRKNETRTIIQKTNGVLKREISSDFSSKIITFLQQHFNDKAINILRVFLENKSNNIIFIEDNSEAEKIDFLPLDLASLSIHENVSYDKNVYSLDESKLNTINEVFNLHMQASDYEVSEAEYNGLGIGLVIGQYLFVYDIYPLLKENILNEKSIKQSYLKENILLPDQKTCNTSQRIELFKTMISDEDILNIISLLKENIYVTEEHFSLAMQGHANQFFNAAYMIETEYLKYHQFFIPLIEETDSLFGLNNNSNARDHHGHSIKGLKTWINVNGEEQNSISHEQKTIVNKVMHLIPDVAFYFKEKFFEDLLKNILEEIKTQNESLNIEIIDNKTFYINKNSRITNPLYSEASYEHNQEFDFIVNYTKNNGQSSTIVIEAKTKLSKFIVQDQAEKVEKYIENDDLEIFDKYFLVGFNIDDNVYSAMAYFIENLFIDNSLAGLAFRYPLPTTKKDLYCIASNDREILKTNLLALLNQ